MILVYFVIGLIIAAIIARYNKSNKLFWILFTSFMIGIAGATLWHKICQDGDKTSLSMVCPTQTSLPSFTPLCVLANDMEETLSHVQKSVSRYNIPYVDSDYLTPSINIGAYNPRTPIITPKTLSKLCISNTLTQVDNVPTSTSSLVNL